jgi:hypothetical protein
MHWRPVTFVKLNFNERIFAAGFFTGFDKGGCIINDGVKESSLLHNQQFKLYRADSPLNTRFAKVSPLLY